MKTLRWIRVVGYLTIIVIWIGSTSPAVAQSDNPGRLELTASAGFSGLKDDQGTLGTGTNTAAGVAFFVVPNLSVGVEVNRTVHGGLLPLQGQNRRSNGKVTFTSVNASYYFAHTNLRGHPLSPYVIGGAGKVTARRTNDLVRTVTLCCSQFSSSPNYSEQTLREDKIVIQEGAFNLGAGLDFGITSHIFLRPEFRFFGASSQNMRRESLILAFRW